MEPWKWQQMLWTVGFLSLTYIPLQSVAIWKCRGVARLAAALPLLFCFQTALFTAVFLMLNICGCQRSEPVQNISKTAVSAKPNDANASLSLKLDGKHHQIVSTLAISPDDSLVLVGGYGRVGVYAVADFQQVTETKPKGLDEKIGSCDALIFSPEGKTFVEYSRHSLSEWDVATGLRVPAPSTPHGATFDWRSRMQARHVSPDGNTKLDIRKTSRSQPQFVEVRTVTPDALKFELKHQDFVNDAGFSPDGKWIVTASGKPTSLGGGPGRFQIWDAQSGQLKAEKELEMKVTSFAFTSDGKVLLTAHGFEVRKWSLDSLLELQR